MEKLFDKYNIIKLSEMLVKKNENEAIGDMADCLTVLKIVCCGYPEEFCNKLIFSTFNIEECVTTLLKIKSFKEKLKTNPVHCYTIANALLKISYFTKDLGNSLQSIVELLPNHTEEKRIIVKEIFTHQSLKNFPLGLIETIIKEDSSDIEFKLVAMYTEKLENSPKSVSFDLWIDWCIHSQLLFQIVTSIMNQLLCTVKYTQIFLEIIQNFMNETLTICKNNNIDFVSLYPVNIQPLISLMYILHTETLPLNCLDDIKNSVVFKLKNLYHSKPKQAVAVLSHFSQWNKYLTFI